MSLINLLIMSTNSLAVFMASSASCLEHGISGLQNSPSPYRVGRTGDKREEKNFEHILVSSSPVRGAAQDPNQDNVIGKP